MGTLYGKYRFRCPASTRPRVEHNQKYISGISRKHLACLYCLYHGRSTPTRCITYAGNYLPLEQKETTINRALPSSHTKGRAEIPKPATRLLLDSFPSPPLTVPPSKLCNGLSNYLQCGYEPPGQTQTAMFIYNIIGPQLTIHPAEHRMCTVHSYVCLCTYLQDDVSQNESTLHAEIPDPHPPCPRLENLASAKSRRIDEP